MTDKSGREHPKVLIVEDDGAIRRLLLSALGREPVAVHAAADGLQAANLVAVNRYALMLVDFMLPRMSGFEFLRHFRETHPSAATVVLVMTASTDEAVRAIGCELAHGIVRKPFDLPQLVEIIIGISEGWSASQPAARLDHDSSQLAC